MQDSGSFASPPPDMADEVHVRAALGMEAEQARPSRPSGVGTMSANDGDLNRSAQHFTFEREVKCDATTTEAPFLYGSGEC